MTESSPQDFGRRMNTSGVIVLLLAVVSFILGIIAAR